MSRTSKALRRLGVPGLAAVTMVAGLPLILGSANAATGESVTLTPATATASAGTCTLYTVTVRNAAGQNPGSGRTVDVRVTERVAAGAAATETFAPEFCTVTATPGVTFSSAGAGGTAAAPVASTTGSDVISASFVTNANGDVTFGLRAPVTGNAATPDAGVADIVAFLDDTPENNVLDAAEVRATSVLTVTENGTANADAGNPATANTANNSVRSLTATPRTATNFFGEPHSVTVTLRGAANETIIGAFPAADIVSGPNASEAITCTQSDNNGQSVCTYTGLQGNGAGTDQITVFVNQFRATTAAPSTNLNTAALDAGEPSDTVSKTYAVAPTGLAVDLTAGDANSARTTAEDTRQLPGTNRTETFTARVTSAAANTTASGILVRFTVATSGTTDAAVETLSATDVVTDANGIATVTLTDPVGTAGEIVSVTATIRGQAGGTNADTATVSFANATAPASVSIAPTSATSTVGTFRQFTVTARDATGLPVAGATVDITITGVGRLANGNRSATVTTGANGTVVIETTATASETGTQTVTATVTGTTANPGVTAGNAVTRTATATNNFVAASPSPSVSVTPSPSATQSVRLTISVSPSTITPGVQSVVTVRGTPGAAVELQAYSRPSTTYTVVRRGIIGANGTIEFRVVPGTNTRLFAAVTGQTGNESPSVVINVRTALSLTVVRNGSLDYTFQGRILPRRAGQLITLYRVTADGREIITSQVRTDNTGTYRIRRIFVGQGTFGFLTRTGQTLTNAAGVSNNGQARQTSIYAGPQR